MRHPSARTDFGQIKRLQIMLVNVPEWFMLHVCSTPYFAAQIASIYHWSFSVETQQTPPRHTHKHTHTRRRWFYILSHAMYCIWQAKNKNNKIRCLQSNWQCVQYVATQGDVCPSICLSVWDALTWDIQCHSFVGAGSKCCW